jgi:predicted metal-binding protein
VVRDKYTLVEEARTRTIYKTGAVLKEYRTALLIHGDNHTDVTRIAVAIEREAFLDGWYRALALGSGPCRLCKRCEPASGKRACRHAEKSRHSDDETLAPACNRRILVINTNQGTP